MTNQIISNHSRYLNIAFWGVVLGELISLAHEFTFLSHYGKGLLWKVGAAIPENLGTLISFVCGAILWIYLQQAWANKKVFKTVSISTLIAMEGLFCLCLIFSSNDYDNLNVGVSILLILVCLLYCVIFLYVGVVLIVKSEGFLRWTGIFTIVSMLFDSISIFTDDTHNFVLSFIGSLLIVLLNYFLKEGCLEELDDNEVEVGTLQYAQFAYVLFIPFLLICRVVF